MPDYPPDTALICLLLAYNLCCILSQIPRQPRDCITPPQIIGKGWPGFIIIAITYIVPLQFWAIFLTLTFNANMNASETKQQLQMMLQFLVQNRFRNIQWIYHLGMIYPTLSWSINLCCFQLSLWPRTDQNKPNRGYGRLGWTNPTLYGLLSLLDRTGGSISEMTHCMVCPVVSWWQPFCRTRRVCRFLYHTDHSCCSVPEILPSVLFSLLGLTSSLHTQLSTKSTSSHQELLQPKNFHFTDCNDWIALFSLL